MAFVQRGPTSGFLCADEAVLGQDFRLDVIRYPGWPSPRFLLATLGAAVRCDVLYSFFASEHTLLAALAFRLCRKGVVVAVGGYDVANVVDRRYGLSATRRRWVPRLCIRLASALVAHTETALRDLTRLAPDAADRAQVCHLAVDADRWLAPDGPTPRLPRATTMGYLDNESFSRKGIDRFCAAATADPETTYVLVGQVDESARQLLPAPLPPNLHIAGFVEADELRRLLWSTAAYVQLSWHESFGMAVAEAMACGCTPVVSTDPALLEVGGEWAVVSAGPDHDVDAIRAGVGRAVDRSALREDALRRFSLARRKEVLSELLRTAANRRRAG